MISEVAGSAEENQRQSCWWRRACACE